MIDIQFIVAGLARAMRDADFPSAETISAALALDVSAAKITKTKSGGLGIVDARLDGGIEVGVAAGTAPKRKIILVFMDSPIPWREFANMEFGANQRIQHSKFSAGFGVLFDLGELLGAVTASGSDGVLDSVSCEAV